MEYNRYCDSGAKLTEAASLAIFHSIATKIDKKMALRVTSTTEPPYSIKKTTQIVEYSVVTLGQCEFLKPLDTSILSMIPESYSDLIKNLTELLETKKQSKKTRPSGFQHPKILAKLKITPQYRHESPNKCTISNKKKK